MNNNLLKTFPSEYMNYFNKGYSYFGDDTTPRLELYGRFGDTMNQTSHDNFHNQAMKDVEIRLQSNKNSQNNYLSAPKFRVKTTNKGGNKLFFVNNSCNDNEMRGGTAQTVQGQNLVRKLLRDRVEQFNQIDSSNLDMLAPEQPQATPDLTGLQSSKMELNLLFNDMSDMVDTGVIKDLFSTASKYLSTLLKILPSFDRSDVNYLIETLNRIKEIRTSLLNFDTLSRDDLRLSGKDKVLLSRTIQLSQAKIELIEKIIEAYIPHVNKPFNEREVIAKQLAKESLKRATTLNKEERRKPADIQTPDISTAQSQAEAIMKRIKEAKPRPPPAPARLVPASQRGIPAPEPPQPREPDLRGQPIPQPQIPLIETRQRPAQPQAQPQRVREGYVPIGVRVGEPRNPANRPRTQPQAQPQINFRETLKNNLRGLSQDDLLESARIEGVDTRGKTRENIIEDIVDNYYPARGGRIKKLKGKSKPKLKGKGKSKRGGILKNLLMDEEQEEQEEQDDYKNAFDYIY